ncbi:flagellin [Bradyrhizobium sp.]|jgi:flagellin-like hook-associated protein FlgL|uniref:flagellin N-terminal helical domain-containing protein n=1 Tax=Bradyrhizobium sp. TaxID=376 RepID=UPI003C2A9572
MTGIVLSASVRQNLLSLQSTASLLATTQNDLATGNKVNSALDNPTNYFTAQSLDNRASDISNLLDSIGNGVQVLQAANTGITSLQSLVASAQSIANQVLQSPVGYSSKASVTSAAIAGATANNLLGTGAALSGDTLTIGATGGGTATSITFGTGPGDISTLNQLNTALAANNLQASIDSSTGAITIETTNDAASATIGAIGGTAVTAAAGAFNGATVNAAVADPNSQATRADLVAQYNNVLQQINTTAQDSSFNGINLLNGDTLNLTFNETGKSTLSINGVTFNDAGLGLSTLTGGTDFLDNNSANAVLSSLTAASTTLRTEASALGSNLTIVQIRQDFNKNLINVLQTGSSNLTLADSNEEAANSQALSTRQSIAVSALALANQSQQSVLQLLR